MRLAVLAAVAAILAGCVTTQGGTAPQSFLQGRETVEVGKVNYAGSWVPLLAHISWPKGQGPFPAVVYMGGCNGWDNTGSAYMPEQVSWLEGRGYAVVMLDSLGSRKVVNTCAIDPKTGKYVDSDDLARDARIAYAWLAQNPKIKTDRIGLFGFSAGGGGAVAVAQGDTKDYRAVFAIYGWCPKGSAGNTWTHNMTFVAGEYDNEIFPERCKLPHVAPGVVTDIHLYPGVNHGYMLPELSQGVTVQRGYGATVYLKYDGPARADTIKRMQAWFDRWLLG